MQKVYKQHNINIRYKHSHYKLQLYKPKNCACLINTYKTIHAKRTQKKHNILIQDTKTTIINCGVSNIYNFIHVRYGVILLHSYAVVCDSSLSDGSCMFFCSVTLA